MSGVKLFGKTIGLPPEPVDAPAEIFQPAGGAGETGSNLNPDCSLLEYAKSNRDDGEDPDSRQSQSNTPPTGPDKAALKKPETILPCPRCKSMETKFCYFNNYNVNQPRHFCRNCQRYWTAGGTMRNVPVGAGRRKNKNILAAANHFRPPVNHPNNTILVFNSDTGAPPCDSMVSVLSIVDKTPRSLEMDGDDGSSGSSDSSSKDEMGGTGNVPVRHNGHWPYQWTSPPTFVPGIIPLPFHSTTLPPYWGGPAICKVPFLITPPASSPPTLGKHFRDENTSKTQESSYSKDNLQKPLWGPKTLRIDDPREVEAEAEKSSSIWATLGKAFQSQSKGEQETEIKVQETPTALQANPAALSRSVSFHESS